MGWDSARYTCKKAFVADITKDYETSKSSRKLLKRSVKSGMIWALFQYHWKETNTIENSIVCFLTRQKRIDMSFTEYSYKDIPYDMEPCYYNCPLSYLKLVKFTTSSQLKWKADVEKYWNDKKLKVAPKVGNTYTLVNSTDKGHVKLLEKIEHSRSFVGLHVETGKKYRISRKFIGELVEIQ